MLCEFVVFSPHFPSLLSSLTLSPTPIPSLFLAVVYIWVRMTRPQEGRLMSSSNGSPPSPLRRHSPDLGMVVL